MPAGHGEAASALPLGWAKPSQAQLLLALALVHVWYAGGSRRTSGLEKSGEGLSRQAGATGSLGAFLACERLETPCKLTDCESVFMQQDELGQRAPVPPPPAVGMGGIWPVDELLDPQLVAVLAPPVKLVLILPASQVHCYTSSAHLHGPWTAQLC